MAVHAMVNLADDTIVALSTPPGRGALATVRVSGSRAHEICRRVLYPWAATPRHATLAVVRDPSGGATLDQVIAVQYEAPRSYTGEAMVEITGHGGALSPAAIIGLLVQQGARLAGPGEFTQRAVLNGKLDLLQAESISDVIDARTEALRRAALFQLDGGLSVRIAALRDGVLRLEGLLAYEIDFPEEDDGPIPRDRISRAISELRDGIDTLLATVTVGEAVRDGAMVVIAGRPNVGKSSLFNALLGYHRAIVTEMPGTTRDALEALIESNRWPLRLVDTAGLRESSDTIERHGVEISRRYLSAADVALVCEDEMSELAASVSAVRQISTAPIVAVRTKGDLEHRQSARIASVPYAESVVQVSAATRTGLPELIESLNGLLDRHIGAITPDAPMLTRARHRAALAIAKEELDAFAVAWNASAIPTSIAAVHARHAAHALEELIGAVGVEDVLATVFASFCIGK